MTLEKEHSVPDPQFECLLTDNTDQTENAAVMAALRSALDQLDVPEPTPAQLAVRQRNHERLVRLGLKPA